MLQELNLALQIAGVFLCVFERHVKGDVRFVAHFWLLRAKVNTVPFLAVHRPAAKWTPLRELMDAIPRKMDTSAT